MQIVCLIMQISTLNKVKNELSKQTNKQTKSKQRHWHQFEVYFKGTLMQIWKSLHMFVLI